MPSFSDTTSSVESTPSPTDDDLSESSVPSSHTFVSEMVIPSLPDGPVSLGDVAAACDGCPHDDLVWLPGLLVMAADLTIARVSAARGPTAPSDGDAPPHVGEHLACAACTIKSLLEIVLKLRKEQDAPQEAQPTQQTVSQQALIFGHDDILQAALHLRSEVYHVAVRHRISVPVCAWERGIPGRPSTDAVVRRTGIHWAGDGKRGATKFQEAEGVPAPVTAVLQKLRVAAALVGAAPSATQKDPKRCVSPHLRQDPLDMTSVLPCELSQGPIASGRGPLRALQDIEFSWPLPADVRALFDAKKWDAPVFDPTAHAAARRVTEALRQLVDLSARQSASSGLPPKAVPCNTEGIEGQGGAAQSGQRHKRTRSPLPASKGPVDVRPNRLGEAAGDRADIDKKWAALQAKKAEMEATLRDLKQRQAVDALVVQVNAAKATYCGALLKTILFPMTLLQLLQTVLIDNMDNSDQSEPAVEDHLDTQVSGRCPLRAALLAGWAASTCELREPVSCKMLDEAMAKMHLQYNDGVALWERERTSRRYNELFKIAHMIDGACPECGKVGQCATKAGYPICGEDKGKGKRSLPTIEKKAHIIPHAAAKLSETVRLLHRVDSQSTRHGMDMAGYLAMPHNVFYLSTCFEKCFDNGTLVLVKVGPPELQCYQVTSTPSTRGTEVAFDDDLQMRDLLSHNQALVLLSDIDGLVVNLARPTFGSSNGETVFVPRVSHRYLDLHARAHNPQFHKAPLVAHKYTLPTEAVQDAPERYAEGLTAITIEAWLDELASGRRPPSGAAHRQRI